MSFIGSMFSNSKGSGYQGQAAPIANPTNPGQVAQAYNQTQSGLGQQQDFLNALAAQGGLGNQAGAMANQQALAHDMAVQNGVGNQGSVFGQQQALANQLQGMANGSGPNPAQAQLAQQTGANTANQAALMAGQRGAGANSGLMARQAGQIGAANQQQAVGQGATLQAQQQLAAIQALQNQQGAMGNLANAQVGQQMGQNAQVAGLANQQVGQQQQGIQNFNQAAQSQQANLLGAQGQNNATNASMQGNINNVGAEIAKGNQAGQQNALSGAVSGLSGIMGMGGGGGAPAGGMNPADLGAMAHGGPVMKPAYADGGAVGPQSNVGKFLYSSAPDATAPAMSNMPTMPMSMPSTAQSGKAMGGGLAAMAMKAAPLMMMASKGGRAPVVGEQLASEGKQVPGKASVKGDSLKNDTVDAKLSPGEIVIPRSVVNSKDPAKESAKFVAAILARQGKR